MRHFTITSAIAIALLSFNANSFAESRNVSDLTTMDTLDNQHPVIKAAYHNYTGENTTAKKAVAAIQRPDSIYKKKVGAGTLECWNYKFTINNDPDPYSFYVAFNPAGQTVTYGYVTCQEADQKGWLNKLEPMRSN